MVVLIIFKIDLTFDIKGFYYLSKRADPGFYSQLSSILLIVYDMFIWEVSQLWGNIKHERKKKVFGKHLLVFIIMLGVSCFFLPFLTRLRKLTKIFRSHTSMKAAIQKYHKHPTFLGIELMTTVSAVKHANH